MTKFEDKKAKDARAGRCFTDEEIHKLLFLFDKFIAHTKIIKESNIALGADEGEGRGASESATLDKYSCPGSMKVCARRCGQSGYVRNMRPTFGYLVALTWAAQMFALAYIIIFKPQYAGDLINAMSSMSAIWAVGLSVLGVYVYKRSEDKKHIRLNRERV